MVSWDPPVAPISLNQSIECDQSTFQETLTANDTPLKVQSYNLFLNHEIYTIINASEDLFVLIDDVDLNAVRF